MLLINRQEKYCSKKILVMLPTFQHPLRATAKFLSLHLIRLCLFPLNNLHSNSVDSWVFLHMLGRPLNAFRLGVPFPKLDGTFNPSLLYGEGNIFNFGYVRIEDGREDDDNDKPHLIAEIRDENGIARPGSMLDLIPQ
jgi:hypothetical protein